MKSIYSTLLFVIITLSTLNSSAQENTYNIVNPEVSENIDSYIQSLNNAQLDRYRYQNQRNVMKFESGIQVELFSADELIENNISVDLNRIKTGEIVIPHPYTFQLSLSGIIVEKMTIAPSKNN